MEFRFENRIKSVDLWKIAMMQTYLSMAGLVNVIFTVAMIVLYIKFGKKVNDLVELLIIVGCVWFPFVHPFLVLLGARRQVVQMPKDLVLKFDDRGMHVTADNKKQHTVWRDIKGVAKRYNMIFIRSDAKQGYVLNNKMLGNQKEEFWAFLQSKVSHN